MFTSYYHPISQINHECVDAIFRFILMVFMHDLYSFVVSLICLVVSLTYESKLFTNS